MDRPTTSLTPPLPSTPPKDAGSDIAIPSMSRRGLLRAGAVAGGGLVVTTLAACAPAAARPGWTFGTALGGASPAAPGSPAPTAAPDVSHGTEPSSSPGSDHEVHDANALAAVERFLGGEAATMPMGNQPLEPRTDGDTKVFELTIDHIRHRLDAMKDPVEALGFNGTWPGPRLTVVEGDKVRVIFTNNLTESTGIHFHGQRVPNNMDGVPHVTQEPIQPGDSFTYEFTARVPGSHMYHSHHNATDQVGRGLLGAFIVEPRDPGQRYDRLYGASQDIVWISNDALGGFTINGRGFPATEPIVATLGDTIVIRFMNEGNMMHPWHLHGTPMRVIARDGYPLGPASFLCDTLGVNPGERWDVVINCDEPGAWAFHCHILQHAEGRDGMFGMVTALVVQEAATAAASTVRGTIGPVAAAAGAAGSTAFLCRIPGLG